MGFLKYLLKMTIEILLFTIKSRKIIKRKIAYLYENHLLIGKLLINKYMYMTIKIYLPSWSLLKTNFVKNQISFSSPDSLVTT